MCLDGFAVDSLYHRIVEGGVEFESKIEWLVGERAIDEVRVRRGTRQAQSSQAPELPRVHCHSIGSLTVSCHVPPTGSRD